MRVREIWAQVVKTRYTRALEAEVARLRAENRGLLNSILGIAGIPPIVVDSANPSTGPTPEQTVGAAAGTSAASGSAILGRAKRDGGRASSQHRVAGIPAAVRHRSWQQVNRMLEIDAIRKREQEPVAVTHDGVK